MTAAEFRAHREALNLTQQGLASLWGVTKRTVIRWEQEGPPKMAELLMRHQSAETPPA